jgi:hypothetical protein
MSELQNRKGGQITKRLRKGSGIPTLFAAYTGKDGKKERAHQEPVNNLSAVDPYGAAPPYYGAGI